ncbi:MAG: hypothetical protein A2Y15_05810 [Clostridiales bacterium GWF2_36_10]|nr:MAG: hypothetical protein A2Y15_05810 [Clostridiales bacterium GWF2_36_10]HAN21626.1 hypothetical protein [Clostridiales bacterium]
MFIVERVLIDENNHEANITCGGSSFLITTSDFERLMLNEGDELDEEAYEQLNEANSRLACIKKAFTYLSYGDMSAKKLTDKLCAKFDKNTVTDVVELLKERRYLNDTELAERFAKSFYEFKHWGPIRIKNDLYARGFLKDDINIACEFLEETDHRDNIKSIISEKYGINSELITPQKQKISAYLYRMGYAYGDITDAINSIIE